MDGPLTNNKVILLQALQTPSVGVVGLVPLPVGHVSAGSDALLSMFDTMALLTFTGACGLSADHQLLPAENYAFPSLTDGKGGPV